MCTNTKSHPTWVRGLKRALAYHRRKSRRSHPTWVRGLKLRSASEYRELSQVAPYVGAWIETVIKGEENAEIESHPTWMRGLKPQQRKRITKLN